MFVSYILTKNLDDVHDLWCQVQWKSLPFHMHFFHSCVSRLQWVNHKEELICTPLHTHSFQPTNQALQNIYTFCIVIISWRGYCNIKTILEVENKKLWLILWFHLDQNCWRKNKKGDGKRDLYTPISKKLVAKTFFLMTCMFAKNTSLLPHYIMMSR